MNVQTLNRSTIVDNICRCQRLPEYGIVEEVVFHQDLMSLSLILEATSDRM